MRKNRVLKLLYKKHLNCSFFFFFLAIPRSLQNLSSPTRIKPNQWKCRVQLFVIPWTAACQDSLTISWRLPKFMSIESLMPFNLLILCHPLLLLPSIFPSISVFCSESALHIRWSKYWSFSFSISPSVSIQGWFPFRLTGLISLLSKEL